MNPRRPPRRRRVPTWLLGVVVAGFLAGSVTLFVLDATRDDSPSKPKAAERQRSGDEGELVLPEQDDEATDSRRRSELGRGRSTADGDDATEEDADEADEDARLDALDGKTIALVPADATAVNGSDASTLERIGTLRLPCAPSGAPAELKRQRELLDGIARRLRAAGARVERVDDARGAVPCVGDRSAAYERADLTLVVATGEDTPKAIVARNAGKLTTADSKRARALVDALGSELDVDVVASTGMPRIADLLDEHGVIDRPGGGTVAWLALGEDAADLELDKLAGSITSALARTFAPPAATPPATTRRPATTTRPAPTPAPTPTPTTPTTPSPATPKPTTPTTPSDEAAPGSGTGSSGPDSDD